MTSCLESAIKLVAEEITCDQVPNECNFCNPEQNFYEYTRCSATDMTCNFCVGSDYSKNTTFELLCPSTPLSQSTAMGLSFLGSNYLYYGHYGIGVMFLLSFLSWILLIVFAFTLPRNCMSDCSRTACIVFFTIIIQVWFWWFVAACSMTGDNYVLPNYNKYGAYCSFNCDYKLNVFDMVNTYPSF